MNRPYRSLAIGGTWLIGIGLVLLVQQGSGWSWDAAWPLFVVLAGAAGCISAVVRGSRGLGLVWILTWPVATLFIGIALLASTTGSVSVGPAELVGTWWPWAAVVLGAWFVVGAFVTGGRLMEQLVVPLGSAVRAQVRIKFGAGRLATHRSAAGSLVDGDFGGGVRHRLDGPGQVELAQDLDGGLPWFDHNASWDVGLTADVPLELRLDTGACQASIDLAELHVSRLELHTGASETRVRLPRAAGSTSVIAEAGAASLTLEVPAGVAARIQTRMALGNTRIDPALFPRTGDVYQSPNYGAAANQVDIRVQAGIGQLTVVGSS